MALQANIKPRPRALSGAGTHIAGGNIYDYAETNSDLDAEKWYGSPSSAGVVDQMLKDAHVRMSLEYITSPLRAATWVFEPGGNSEAEKEAADFCNWVFLERLNWDRFLREATTMKSHGFSIFEVTDDIATIPQNRFKLHPGEGKGVVVTGLHHRPAFTTHRWIQSKRNPTQIEAWEQYILPSDGEEGGIRRIAADRLLRFTENQIGAVFHGVPTLRSAYAAWKIKLTLSVIEAIGHERSHGGTPTIRLPEGAQDADLKFAAETLAAMQTNEKGYMILPHGFEFAWETAKGGAQDIRTSIERCNRDISLNTGSAFMLLGLQGGGGSYNLAATQQGQFQLQIESDSRFIAQTFSRGSDGWSPVERLVAMNYGSDVAAPVLNVRNTPTRDWGKVLPIVHNLAMSSMLTPDAATEDFIREVLRLPKAEPETARSSSGEPLPMEFKDDE